MKQAHLTLTKTMTMTLMLTEDMMKTLLLQEGRANFLFGQAHRTLGILVMFVLSLVVPVD
jgi:hypothetical protein